MTTLTGIRDVDRSILLQLDDISLGNICKVNKYAAAICADDNFWRLKVMKNSRYLPANLHGKYREFYVKSTLISVSPDMLLNKNLGWNIKLPPIGEITPGFAIVRNNSRVMSFKDFSEFDLLDVKFYPLIKQLTLNVPIDLFRTIYYPIEVSEKIGITPRDISWAIYNFYKSPFNPDDPLMLSNRKDSVGLDALFRNSHLSRTPPTNMQLMRDQTRFGGLTYNAETNQYYLKLD